MGKTAIPDAKRGTVFYVDPDDVTIIGLDTKDGQEHPLWTPGAAGLQPDAEQVASIKAFGVKEAVGVRKDGDALQVIKGRHRTVSAREANRQLKGDWRETKMMPVVVIKGDDRDMLLEVQIENSCRVERSPMDRAREAKRLLDCGIGEPTAATAMGMNAVEFTQHLNLFDLAAPLQQAVHRGALSMSAAQKLRKLPREEQIKQFRESETSGKKVTVKRAAAAVAKKNGNGNGRAAPGKRQLKAIADELIKVAPGGEQSALLGFRLGVEFAAGLASEEAAKQSIHGLRGVLDDLAKRKEPEVTAGAGG